MYSAKSWRFNNKEDKQILFCHGTHKNKNVRSDKCYEENKIVIMSVLCSGRKWNYAFKKNVTLNWNLNNELKGAILEN